MSDGRQVTVICTNSQKSDNEIYEQFYRRFFVVLHDIHRFHSEVPFLLCHHSLVLLIFFKHFFIGISVFDLFICLLSLPCDPFALSTRKKYNWIFIDFIQFAWKSLHHQFNLVKLDWTGTILCITMLCAIFQHLSWLKVQILKFQLQKFVFFS